jgi:hypothetical protein
MTSAGRANKQTGAHSDKFWATVIAIANIVHLWLFFHSDRDQPVRFWLFVVIHVVACVGPIWVLAHWFVKRQKKLRWESWMWLLLAPWGFLWYVFEKWEPVESELLKTGR